LTNPDVILHYLAPQLKSGESDTGRSGRIDDVFLSYDKISENPITLVTGLGIGAVTRSPVDVFSPDQYSDLVKSGVVSTSMSVLLLEMGVMGLLLISIGAYMVWRSAKICMHDPELAGAIGLAWLAVVPLLYIAFFWKNFLANDPITAVFAYFTGHVLASAYRQKNANSWNLQTEKRHKHQDMVLAESDTNLPPILQAASVRTG